MGSLGSYFFLPTTKSFTEQKEQKQFSKIVENMASLYQDMAVQPHYMTIVCHELAFYGQDIAL